MVDKEDNKNPLTTDEIDKAKTQSIPSDQSKEHGGPKGPEPTRFGDWEKGGRCIDF